MSEALSTLIWAAAGLALQAPPPEVEHHLDLASRARIQASIERGAGALLELQADDGAFRSRTESGVPDLALTSLALWALSESEHPVAKPEFLGRAASYVLSFQHPDGGIYDSRRGLVRYTAAIARQGLEAFLSRHPRPDLRARMDDLVLFVYRNRDPESLEDEKRRVPPGVTAAEVDRVLARPDLPEDVRAALDFLKRAREKPTDGPPRRLPPANGAGAREGESVLTYEELLRYICEMARRDNPTVSRAYEAIRANYTLRENPDLTKRYGPEGFRQKDAGLFYYYLTVARTLSSVGRPELETISGRKHDWARELSDRLLVLQGKDGLWVNSNSRWWEGDPALSTCYALLALSACRDLRAKPR